MCVLLLPCACVCVAAAVCVCVCVADDDDVETFKIFISGLLGCLLELFYFCNCV